MAILLVAITGLSAACEEDEETSTDLHLLEWNGYQHPQFFPEYMAKYGRPPAFTFFDNADNAMKRMRTGYQVDLVHLCTGQLSQSKDAGLIRPIDTSRIPRWSTITPELLDLPDVRMEGEHWMVPWEWGYSTVAYNPNVIDIENPSYEMFIDPQFKGKTALTSDITVNFIIAGVIAGWADPLDPTEEEMDEAPEIFTKMLENARFIWTDGTQMEQAWAAGDVSISYIFGSATRRMRKEGLDNVVVEPLQTWMCGLAVSTNGRASDEEVYDYLNAMLDPASGVAMFDMYGYGHGNSTTASTMDPELIAGTGIDDPAGTFARGVYTRAHPPAKKTRLFQLWFEAQAGLE
jgi:spermidine/putrescine transport system substrate-binding protein